MSMDDENSPDWRVQLPQQTALTDPAQAEEEEIEETAADRIARMLGDISADDRAKVMLYRVIGPKKYSFCDEYPAADFETGFLSLIREEWGTGEYQVRLYCYAPDHRGKMMFTVRAMQNIVIERRKGEAANPTPRENSEIAAVLRGMQDQQKAMLDAITNRPQVDPLAQFQQMAAMAGAMKELIGGGQGGNSISEIMKAIREMKEVAGELNPPKESDDADPMLSMLPKMMEMISAAQRAPQAQPMPAIALPPSLAGAAPQTPIPEQTEIPQPENADVNMLEILRLKSQLSQLVKWATEKADPQKGGEFIYEKIPDDMIEILGLEIWFDTLAQFAPEVQAHREWLTKARDLALKMFDDDAATEDHPGTAA